VTKHFIKDCCSYGKPGDRLWVRETWYCDHNEVTRGPYLKPDDLDVSEARDDGTLVYAADGLAPYETDQPIWNPSIHMPRWACRILLEITDVRVERLQDISDDQAKAGGCFFSDYGLKCGHSGTGWTDVGTCPAPEEHEGVLIFKWNETQVTVSELLALTDEKPLFGHKSGKREKTHWITFMKRPAP
jgi:hypothetical protein